MADRLGAMRGPGESYSDVILRMVETDAYGGRGRGQSCGSFRRD
jgi:hypothetical protein